MGGGESETVQSSKELQNLFSQLEVQATQTLIAKERENLKEFQNDLKNAQLNWAVLQVERRVFGSEDLDDDVQWDQLQDRVKQAQERLAKIEAYLTLLQTPGRAV